MKYLTVVFIKKFNIFNEYYIYGKPISTKSYLSRVEMKLVIGKSKRIDHNKNLRRILPNGSNSSPEIRNFKEKKLG